MRSAWECDWAATAALWVLERGVGREEREGCAGGAALGVAVARAVDMGLLDETDGEEEEDEEAEEAEDEGAGKMDPG